MNKEQKLELLLQTLNDFGVIVKRSQGNVNYISIRLKEDDGSLVDVVFDDDDFIDIIYD